MKLINRISMLSLFGGAVLLMSYLTNLNVETPSSIQNSGIPSSDISNHHNPKGGFINTANDFNDNTAILPLLIRYATEKRIDAIPEHVIPVQSVTQSQLNNMKSDTIIRLGHSSLFMQLNGQKWLIDPVFSDRASPFSFIGPKRFHQPPIALSDLPDIDGILISHDHYDHLDEASIKFLAQKVKHFVVPLGVDHHLKKWQVPTNTIHALDWWQSITLDGITLTATPTQHFSGRGLFDKNETLWASYVIKTPDSSLFFSGDSGYFDGFKAIGERFGPFDITMIETGAYDKDWADIHMTPEQSLQAHIDLKGRNMLPIHNGTFDLAFHAWYEPFNRIAQLAHQAHVPLLTPIMGQAITVNKLPQTKEWWNTFVPSKNQ
ncbi:MBL fold metallo-hydrolase [uncultured Shewanella sp.]|uniref:MBL fold metallo-hydrolase n=1 Tax=uncultured Shewanella sp. TaxID=173975 RepID=UPI002607F27B|nr:MBL fold metallo-hydrolase [uncultured Shewanella sp.]